MSMTDSETATALDVEPQPNLPLLRKILHHIDAHPDQWDQGLFEWYDPCGTTFCVAGWATVLTHGYSGSGPKEDLPFLNAEDVGRQALGLTMDEAEAMFYDTCGSFGTTKAMQRANVQAVAERIAARAGEVL